MKVSNSKERIRELMSFYGINQTELCKRTGIQKSALSNYLNGDREPRQDQISLICDPFGVSPAWLMGYDVPMTMPVPAAGSDSDITAEAMELSRMISSLPHDKQLELRDYIQYLLSKA